MKIELILGSLPHLVQVMAVAQTTVTAIVAAMRAAHPAELEHVTDAQIIAGYVEGASTGVEHADALIDRLRARVATAPDAEG